MKLKNKKRLEKQKDIENVIEEVELHDMSEKDIEVFVSAFSTEGIQLRAKRKKIRYSLYRIRTESVGGCASEATSEFIESFEKQPGFNGWRFFATNWDVSFDDPMKVVSRDLSEQEEWDNVVRSKFPQIQHDGTVKYPDIRVKRRVEAEAASREK